MGAHAVATRPRWIVETPRKAGLPQLQFERDGKCLFIHPLRGRVVIGRSDRCDVALPGDQISRRHAVFQQRGDDWMVVDRSRHGIRVNGRPAERAFLRLDDVVEIGPYTVRFTASGLQEMGASTAGMAVFAGQPEELVAVERDQVATTRAQVRFVRGAVEGQVAPLKRSRVTVGGPGSDLVLGDELPQDSVVLHVVRGRVIVAPGELLPRLAGQVVREPTPVYPGERLELRSHAFVIETETQLRGATRRSFGQMVGHSPVMTQLFGTLSRIAVHDHAVLLTGESGTGKELAARALHGESRRAHQPFVAVNCAALSDHLVESELFGHVKGAFTGASGDHDGAFVQATGGVIFLDEVGELKLTAQAKLLRVLESGEVRAVGGGTPRFPDVRVIAATNRDLQAMCAAGTFREDLFFRLAVLPVTLPPLRDHAADIVPLAQELLARHHPGASLSISAQKALAAYAWPGNARELRNVLTRAVVLHGTALSASKLEFRPDTFRDASTGPKLEVDGERERRVLLACLERHGFNRSAAARDLGIPRSSLLYKMKRWGIR